MCKYFLACFFAMFAFSVSAGHGGSVGKAGAGGYIGNKSADGADGGNDSDGGSASNTPGRPGCPGGTAPDFSGKFYLPGTKQECNPGRQDLLKKHQPVVIGT
ncbi:hypothetical protein KXR87_18100 [Yokenella regensburgei]|uniref:hypothetical protein n=1 Tax=Yokenella regensburgei TaxID=158877 RepID=UPI003F156F96